MSEIDLNSPEIKKAIADAVAEEVQGLKAKNDELLEKLRKAKQGQQIDPAELAAIERERDDWRDKAGKLEKDLKKVSSELDAIKQDRDTIASQYANSLKEAALTEELTKAGITNPVHLKAAKALLGSAVEVVEDNGQRVVRAGEKALKDFITEWAGGEEGKHFRVNGAEGGNANPLPPGGETLKRSAMSIAAKADYIRKHGEDAYNKLPE